jgi:hypothetical protein
MKGIGMGSTTLQIDEGQLITLRKVALQLGYTLARGPGAHTQGNVSKLVRAIAEAATDPTFVEVLGRYLKEVSERGA